MEKGFHLHCIEQVLCLDRRVKGTESDIITYILDDNVDGLRRTLGRGFDLRVKLSVGVHALTLAAAKAGPEVIKLLLEKGAPLDFNSAEGDNAQLVAGKRPGIEALLVSSGSSVNIQVPLVDKRVGSVGNLLMAYSCFESVTQSMVPEIEELYVESMFVLIKAGADVNYTSSSGFTPLMAAAANNSLRKVRLLLSAGAKPNLRSKSGETALSLAKRFTSNESLIDSLVASGAH